MLPPSDGLPARQFPVVNVLLIVASFAVWLLHELPGLNSAIYHASFFPCTLDVPADRGELRAVQRLGERRRRRLLRPRRRFVFGWIVARVLNRGGRIAPQVRQQAPAVGS